LSAPKCTSWLGHRFKARYSVAPGRELSDQELYWTPGGDILEAIKATSVQTYVYDICTRCGCIVNQTGEVDRT
jgi:hypothetical protein